MQGRYGQRQRQRETETKGEREREYSPFCVSKIWIEWKRKKFIVKN